MSPRVFFAVLLLGLLAVDVLWVHPSGRLGQVAPLLLAGALVSAAIRVLFFRSAVWVEVAAGLLLLSSPWWLPGYIGMAGTAVVIVAGFLAMAARRWPAAARSVASQVYRYALYLALLWPLHAVAVIVRLVLHDALLWLVDRGAVWLGFVHVDRRVVRAFPNPLAAPPLVEAHSASPEPGPTSAATTAADAAPPAEPEPKEAEPESKKSGAAPAEAEAPPASGGGEAPAMEEASPAEQGPEAAGAGPGASPA